LDETLGNLLIDRDSFIVIVTRGHKNDADVLRKFIGSGAGYIGMIGSGRKIAQVRESFLGNAWATPEQWNKIYTPIGLEIGSKTVQEIALSIAAQLVNVRNQLKNQ
jgi:xanthine dehydrogenase accessory factor